MVNDLAIPDELITKLTNNWTMRQYTMLDLIRFHKFCAENDLKPGGAIAAYNKAYPEKSAKENLENLKKTVDMSLNSDSYTPDVDPLMTFRKTDLEAWKYIPQKLQND